MSAATIACTVLGTFKGIADSPIGSTVNENPNSLPYCSRVAPSVVHPSWSSDRLNGRPSSRWLARSLSSLLWSINTNSGLIPDSRTSANVRSVPRFYRDAACMDQHGSANSLPARSVPRKYFASLQSDRRTRLRRLRQPHLYRDSVAYRSITPCATFGLLASLGFKASVQKWRTPNWLARKRSQPSRDRK